MKKRFIFVTFIFCTISFSSFAQDLLPNFKVTELSKGKVQISWNHRFSNIVQITVQRSFDSTKYFRSIFSSLSPELQQSGYLDKTAPVGYKMFYRILYVFEGGEYVFTKSQSIYSKRNETNTNNNNTDFADDKLIKIYKPNRETLLTTMEYKFYKKFRDSIYTKTKDTLQYTENDDEVIIKPFVAKVVWKASNFVFTNEKGFIRIILPQAKQKKYSLIFFNENNEEVLHIKHIKETDLVLDKTNFLKAGWYFFDLYEDDKLKEKNKFYLSKDR